MVAKLQFGQIESINQLVSTIAVGSDYRVATLMICDTTLKAEAHVTTGKQALGTGYRGP